MDWQPEIAFCFFLFGDRDQNIRKPNASVWTEHGTKEEYISGGLARLQGKDPSQQLTPHLFSTELRAMSEASFGRIAESKLDSAHENCGQRLDLKFQMENPRAKGSRPIIRGVHRTNRATARWWFFACRKEEAAKRKSIECLSNLRRFTNRTNIESPSKRLHDE